MISRDMLVTAHHCGMAPTIFVEFLHDSAVSGAFLNERFEALGFASAQRGAAIAQAMAPWVCDSPSRQGSRDLVYYFCQPKWFTLRPGLSAVMFPGEIFGHLDITAALPSQSTPVHSLTVNSTTSMVTEEVLLSPGGERISPNSQTLVWNSEPYTELAATVGDDAAPGSSGGATLIAATQRAWGVWFGWTNAIPASCYSGTLARASCSENRHFWAPFHPNTTALQFSPPVNNLPPVGSTSNAWLRGGTGGQLASMSCPATQAVIGVVY
jgi:hypothetical protein